MDAIEILVQLLDPSVPDRVRLLAAVEILERA